MELKLLPGHHNIFPPGGLLIKGAGLKTWLLELQRMELSAAQVSLYPVPGTTANSIWGCLVVPQQAIARQLIGQNEWCQAVTPNFMIAENAVVHPPVTPAEISKLLSPAMHLFHPEIGLAGLTETVNWEAVCRMPQVQPVTVTKPAAPLALRMHINSFQIKAVPPEQVLQQMEQTMFPKNEPLRDERLSVREKLKLRVYKSLFRRHRPDGGHAAPLTEKRSLWARISSVFSSGSKKGGHWTDKLEQDFEHLDDRNQDELDKLLKLFKNNPAEALKYAVPLDGDGSSRGGVTGQLSLGKRWHDFSLFGANRPGGSGGATIADDAFIKLQQQYHSTAQLLKDQGDYQKAAFVYMKLLKDYIAAAEALEEGAQYQEAAVVYLKYAHNNTKAAECYENGNMIAEAIELHKELKNHEKVGDLYLAIHKKQEADIYFEQVVDDYKARHQYVKAALVCRHKIQNHAAAQDLLLEGWRQHRDACNCLQDYLANQPDIKAVKKEITAIYGNDLNEQNRETFIRVLKTEYDKKNELAPELKEMAYALVAEQIPHNPSVVAELNGFNTTDKELQKDTLRFRGHYKKSNHS